eukprot:gene5065-7069_t
MSYLFKYWCLSLIYSNHLIPVNGFHTTFQHVNIKIISSVASYKSKRIQSTSATLVQITSINDNFKNIVSGEKIFKVHSAAAAIFGLYCLLLPESYFPILNNHLLLEHIRGWSFYILGCGYIAYSAPSFDEKAKITIARTFCVMFGSAFSYFLFSFPGFLFDGYTDAVVLDILLIPIFFLLTYGYVQSGTTKFNIGIPKFPDFSSLFKK